MMIDDSSSVGVVLFGCSDQVWFPSYHTKMVVGSKRSSSRPFWSIHVRCKPLLGYSRKSVTGTFCSYNYSVDAISTFPLKVESTVLFTDVKPDLFRTNTCFRWSSPIAVVWGHSHRYGDKNRPVMTKYEKVCGFDSALLEGITSLRWLRLLDHALRMRTHLPSLCALFAFAEQNRKRRRDGQPATWKRSLKKFTSSLAAVELYHLPCWDRSDTRTCGTWLETEISGVNAVWFAVMTPHLPPYMHKKIKRQIRKIKAICAKVRKNLSL